MTKYLRLRGDRGAASLFIVLFATLLFTVITVGFLSLMISDQRRATDSEWSEGAYDSALAGVEDGKRVLAMCRDDATSPACNAIRAESCSTIVDAGLVDATDGEVLLQSQDGLSLAGQSIGQAYSCVIIRRDTPDYIGRLERDESVVVPLKSGGEEYDQIVLSWFTLNNSPTGATFGAGSDTSLPILSDASDNWPSTRPPIMRTQFMQYNRSNIQLNDFDQDDYAHTAFLYPSEVGLDTSSNPVDIANDDERDPGDIDSSSTKIAPRSILCTATIPPVGYACVVTIDIPDLPSGSASQREALVRLTALYGAADYKLQMRNSDTDEVVDFVGTQPSIDSTGRAGDVFRRVDARIDMTGAASDPYPRATIDVTDKLCKNFSIGTVNTQWECD